MPPTMPDPALRDAVLTACSARDDFMASRANLQLPLLFLCYSSDLTSVDLIGTRPDICDAVFTSVPGESRQTQG